MIVTYHMGNSFIAKAYKFDLYPFLPEIKLILII